MLLNRDEISGYQAEIEAVGEAFFGDATASFIKYIIGNTNNSESHRRVFVRTAGSRVVAFLILSTVLDESEILQVAVKKECQRCGLAAALLDEVFDFCMKSGISKIFLEVREGNFPARLLYKKFEFEEAGLRRDYYENPRENGIVMSKNLSVSAAEKPKK
ncbi:ribosomal protein S18-alanine N-acetyltransferase [bacterium]|nr:ribosomal protein S18-alanine N-acetyltransferase [bacterium]